MMRLKGGRLARRIRTWTAVLGAGVIFQAGGCSVQFSDLLFDLSASILGQLISSYVNDQLNVTPGFF